MKLSKILIAAGIASAVASTPVSATDTLADVTALGFLKCGVKNVISPGFSGPYDDGAAGDGAYDTDGNFQNNRGFDSDYCRAVATAIFGSAVTSSDGKVGDAPGGGPNCDRHPHHPKCAGVSDPITLEFVPASASARFNLLDSGAVDVLIRTTTDNFSRDTSLNVDFTNTTFYDGQGFMGLMSSSLGSTLAALKTALTGAIICVEKDTTTESNLDAFIEEQGITGTTINRGRGVTDFDWQTGDKLPDPADDPGFTPCTIVTGDSSGLVGTNVARAARTTTPYDIYKGPLISDEPLAPTVRHDDNDWKDLVHWVVNATIRAEDLGLLQEDAVALLGGAETSGVCTADLPNGELKNLCGQNAAFGDSLALDGDWALRVIAAIGNYGEAYERNFCKTDLTDKAGDGFSCIAIARGKNNLVTTVTDVGAPRGQQFASPLK